MPEPKKIEELWAWICTEPDGGEGVVATSGLVAGMLMPLVGADAERMKSLEAHALAIGRLTGLPVRLERFRGSLFLEKLADHALRLAEMAEIETGQAETDTKEGREALAAGRLGKAQGFIEASTLLQALVRAEL
jgi:hypothetical protein